MINILTTNFGFKKVDVPPYGLAVEMDVRDAFRYSLIEGSPYLTTEYGFTCKGRMNVFYHRSSLNNGYYTYCPGLFGVKQTNGVISLDEGHAPYYINKKYPQIFKDKKTVIFLEHDSKNTTSRVELERKVFEELKKQGNNPSNYLLTIVTDRQSLKEAFFEFVACQYFNSKGYLTECQVPFKNNEGIPDFAAYSIPYLKDLIDNELISGGCCIPEIAAACVFDNKSTTIQHLEPNKIMIGEVKTTQKNASSQINKIIKTNLTDYVFEIIPFKKNRATNCGLLRVDESDLKINFESGPAQKPDNNIHAEDEKFLENYIKFYILANLSIEKIKQKFIVESSESESAQLIKGVLSQDLKDIIKFVRSEM